MTRNPFQGSQLYDALVFESPRSATVDNRRMCAYTSEIANQLTSRGLRVQLLDPHTGGPRDKSPDYRRYLLDAVALESGLRFRLSRWQPQPTDVEFLEKVRRHLSEELSLAVDISWLLSPGVRRFRSARTVYERLLRKRRRSEIYCVAAYGGLAPLVAAAKHMGVRVTEVQHGAIDPYHLGYSFPGQPLASLPDYLPDRLLAWKADWNQVTGPFQVDFVEAGYWERLRRMRTSVSKRHQLLVVLSQPVITGRLARAPMSSRGGPPRVRGGHQASPERAAESGITPVIRTTLSLRQRPFRRGIRPARSARHSRVSGGCLLDGVI